MTAEEVIKKLQLIPLPDEGGYYRETWHAQGFFQNERSLGSAIYYLMTNEPGGWSLPHRLDADEVYHFYAGDPGVLTIFPPEGSGETPREIILGNNLSKGEVPQFVVPAGYIQGLRPLGSWTLLGTTMTPGFHFKGFELISKKELTSLYPMWENQIKLLTP